MSFPPRRKHRQTRLDYNKRFPFWATHFQRFLREQERRNYLNVAFVTYHSTPVEIIDWVAVESPRLDKLFRLSLSLPQHLTQSVKRQPGASESLWRIQEPKSLWLITRHFSPLFDKRTTPIIQSAWSNLTETKKLLSVDHRLPPISAPFFGCYLCAECHMITITRTLSRTRATRRKWSSHNPIRPRS
jgi:hypothetical protein